MAKDNIYDFIISELLYRQNSAVPSGAPYLSVSSNLPFNNRAEFDFNGTVEIISEVKNIPSGYSVQSNTHEIIYPIVFGPDTSSNALFTGAACPLIFTSIGQTFTVTVNVTLEHISDPDINLTTTFTITAEDALYMGSKPLDNTFNLVGLDSYLFIEENQTILLPTTSVEYIYLVLPTGSNAPLFLKDRNGLVIDMSNFTITTTGGYDYYVMQWPTSLPINSYWQIVYNP